MIPRIEVFETIMNFSLENGVMINPVGSGNWIVRVYDDHGGWRAHHDVWPKTWHLRDSLNLRAEE